MLACAKGHGRGHVNAPIHLSTYPPILEETMTELTLKTLVFRFKWQILFTNLLVFFESILGVSLPLFIGLAINDLLDDSLRGVYYLVVLGLLFIAVSSIRRFCDTRIYSKIYRLIAPEMIEKEQEKGSSVSKTIARTHLLAEIVSFLEWSIPAMVGAVIYLVAVLIIIANLSRNVFYASLALLLFVLVVYALTGKINFRLNAQYNNEFEKEVTVLETKNPNTINGYFHTLMGWNVKLADLETSNYLLVMLGIAALLIYTPIAVITKDNSDYYGLVFSIVLYVLEYVSAVVHLPDHIQQMIRLNEISSRLSE